MRLDSLLLSNQARGWWLGHGKGSYRKLHPEAAPTITVQVSASLGISGFYEDSDILLRIFAGILMNTMASLTAFWRHPMHPLPAHHKMPCCDMLTATWSNKIQWSLHRSCRRPCKVRNCDMIINSYRIPAFTEIKMVPANVTCRHSGDEARCTYVVVPYCLSSALPKEASTAATAVSSKALREGNGIGPLGLHTGYLGCMMLVGSDPWLSENKANEVSMKSRL